MKKLLVCLIGVLMFGLCSCDGGQNVYRTDGEKNVIYINTGNVPTSRYDVVEFEYKGHDYIGFSGGHRFGVVHNPECKTCGKEVVE